MTEALQNPSSKLTAQAGLHLLHLEHSALPGEVEVGDMLRVDFTQHQVRREGLYLVHLGAWTGVRRFMGRLCGAWALEADGWQPVPSTLRILGYVAEVHRPGRDALGGREVSHG
ncbi:MAG: hypothetical protein EOO27_01010 [Comamonadaceae bacterium]|nr:MAG: hypothetical protein EOO27_01010 [Comamonadaceae bacterium]